MDEIFEQHAKNIKVYIGKETITDPDEYTVDITLLQPIPIEGIVTDLTTTQAQWKMPGITTDKTKEIIVRKVHRGLIEMSQKILIEGDNDYYNGWRVNGKMQIRETSDRKYIRVYIYSKKES